MKKNIFKRVLQATLLVIVLIGILSYYSTTDHGDHIREDKSDLRQDVALMLSTYDYLVTLVISSFGVIAFLIAYQQQKERPVSDKAWGWLFAAIIMLVGAIISCLFSRELLLVMVTRNAVDLSLHALVLGRWMTYCCMIFSAVLLGFFLLETAKNPIKQD